ncbi:unnamed protein product [Vitrella brassicaformis CCMP3155]|uniref:Uncharacterized protein n=1 Tax=Vitrella brassicaformis (strain CCMP3155) TaxID=1169540 RepID=A0A0G4F773_VITBC|nr:unnamed protein product [Vitrella brassicaformis CCMP3155]|eukprot:CEM08100.1 unnamed protein product [Vitrella brassicaformis CCMP3155]
MSESVDEGAKNTEKKLEGAADQEEDLAAEDIEQLEYQGLTFLEYMEEFEVIKQDALGETRKDIYSYSNSRSTEKQSSPVAVATREPSLEIKPQRLLRSKSAIMPKGLYQG